MKEKSKTPGQRVWVTISFSFTEGVDTSICVSDLRRWELEIVWASFPTEGSHPLDGVRVGEGEGEGNEVKFRIFC